MTISMPVSVSVIPAIPWEGIAIVLGLMLILMATYFLPAVVAYRRGHQHRLAILFCNVAFGWTFIGWGIALVWSGTSVRTRPATYLPESSDQDRRLIEARVAA